MRFYTKTLLFSLISIFAVKCLLAGDFLKLERTPQPTEINEAGVPIYTSYWDPVAGLPKECTEAIGEDGAQHYAEKMGWKKILTAPDKGIVNRGFDQVWMDEETGEVIIVEARGRTDKDRNGQRKWKLSKGYGQTQATIEWSIEVCKNLLVSDKSTAKDREVARLVLQKISEGKIQTRVIVTTHKDGIPRKTWTERIVRDVPDEYRGLTADQLRYLVLEKGETPPEYRDDPNTIEYDMGREQGILAQHTAALDEPARQVIFESIRRYQKNAPAAPPEPEPSQKKQK